MLFKTLETTILFFISVLLFTLATPSNAGDVNSYKTVETTDGKIYSIKVTKLYTWKIPIDETCGKKYALYLEN